MLSLSVPALLLGVGCGLLYSAGDYFRKAAPSSCPPETILFYYIGGHIPVLAAWVAWTGETRLAQGYALPGIAVAVAGLAANLLFIVSIRRSALSLMVPLLALVPVVTLVLGGFFLGEWPTPRQSAGVVMIAAGLFLLFQPPGARLSLRGAWATLRAERGTLPMLAVVALWSATPALDKLCLAHASPALHGLIQVSAIWLALLVWAFARGLRTLHLPAGAARPVAAAALAGGSGYALQLFGYAIAMVAMIEVLKRTVSLIASLVLGRAAFREPLTGAKVAGASTVAAGLALVMLA